MLSRQREVSYEVFVLLIFGSVGLYTAAIRILVGFGRVCATMQCAHLYLGSLPRKTTGRCAPSSLSSLVSLFLPAILINNILRKPRDKIPVWEQIGGIVV
jgi:hypothetical protein